MVVFGTMELQVDQFDSGVGIVLVFWLFSDYFTFEI